MSEVKSERERFLESNLHKSEKTQLLYKRRYDQLRKELDCDINLCSQDKINKIAEEAKSRYSAAAIVNMKIMVNQLYGLPYDALKKQRTKTAGQIKEVIKAKNRTRDIMPSYSEIEDFIDFLSGQKDLKKEFIINKLLFHYGVRNEDLDVELVERRKDMQDESKNYIWIDKRNKKLVWVRHNYKTFYKYGKKTITITDPQLFEAFKALYLDKTRQLIENSAQVGYYVKKATYKQLGEGIYLKILINHFRDDLQKLREISHYRGTELNTMAEYYDVANI